MPSAQTADVTSCLSSASNHLPQQQQTLSRSSRVSQLHLPVLPSRHGVKHLSLPVTRASRDNSAHQLPAPGGRGGGTGRREAVTAPRDTKTSPRLTTPTQTKPWTPQRAALPLTAALTSLSFSLSESEFSADGDEVEPEGPALTFTTAGRTPLSSWSQHRSVTAGARSATAAQSTCAERPCFPGVQCEPEQEGGFRCGRCPAGYIGDGRACRGKRAS